MATKTIRATDMVYQVSPELQAIIGLKKCKTSQAVKGVWDYLKKNNLNKGQLIDTDEKLNPVFGKFVGKAKTLIGKVNKKTGNKRADRTIKPGKKQFVMFNIGKGISEHLKPIQ